MKRRSKMVNFVICLLIAQHAFSQETNLPVENNETNEIREKSNAAYQEPPQKVELYEGQLPENIDSMIDADEHNKLFIHDRLKDSANPSPIITDKTVNLPDLIENTLDYPAVLSAQAEIEASQSDQSAAEMQRYPSVSILTSTDLLRSQTISPIFQVQQPLWTGGRITGQIEEAEGLVGSAEEKKRETGYNVALRVVNAWQNLIDSQNSILINQEVLESLEDYYRFMEHRVEVGVSPKIELQLVITRLKQAEADIATAKANNQVARVQLNQLTNHHYSEQQLSNIPSLDAQILPIQQWLDVHLKKDYGEFVQTIASDYPTVQRAEKDQEVLKARQKIKESAYYPTVSVGYQHIINVNQNYTNGINNSNDNRLTFNVTYQPGAGISAYESAKAASIRAEGSSNAIESARLDVIESVTNDIQDIFANKQRIAMSGASVDASDMVLQSYKRQFIAGKRTWFDVLNALRELSQNKLIVAHAKAVFIGSSYKLMVKNGEFKPSSASTASGS